MWKNIKANSNLIQASTEKAVLIKLPKSEFLFWHPAKLVKTMGKNSYLMSIGYTNEFIFKVFRNGKGQYNKTTKIEEKTLSISEFEAYFAVMETTGKNESEVGAVHESLLDD